MVADLPSYNTELWVLAPDDPEGLEDMRAKMGLEFPVLVDADNSATHRLGLINAKGNLPNPAALVIDREGKVSWIRIDEDYSQRPSVAEVREALEAVNE